MSSPIHYLDLLSRAVAHIDAHLGEPLDGDALAERAAMSRYHFHRIFRAYFGTTVAGYVTWRRLQRACELLSADPTSVLDVAVAVGYDSAQALAKAMRRELDTTPSAVRAGAAPAWQRLFDRRADTRLPDGDPLLKPRLTEAPALWVLTATGRGKDDGDMSRAAQQALAELRPTIDRAGLWPRMRTCLAMFPDEPQGPDDQAARMWLGVVFDHALSTREGIPARVDVPLSGTLAWREIPAGRHAVFTHLGPYSTLHLAWTAIYRDWLPATGYALRDTPPFEHYVNDATTVAPDAVRTDLYMPLQ